MSTPIQFLAENAAMLNALPKPVRAGKVMPTWFHDLPVRPDNTPYEVSTVKKCMPFVDAMTAGYIIPMWCDLHITVDGKDARIDNPPTWQGDKIVANHNASQIANTPFAEYKFGHAPMKLSNPWLIKTPPGWSCLFVPPLNRPSPLLHLFSGVVDTDKYYNNVNFPFILTAEDGEHLIAKGTPIMQVIPFQRVEAHAVTGLLDHDKRNAVVTQLGTLFRDGYKRLFRHSKADEA